MGKMDDNTKTSLYKRVKPKKISDGIFEQIKALIFTGELKPGDKLPPERDLAEYFDVGRSSLREALIQLSAVGLVEAKKTDGYFVRSIAEEMVAPLKSFIEDEMRNLIDFMEVRKMLDIWCAKEAIKKGTEEDYKKIQKTVELTQDAEFHIAIAEAAHNVILCHLISYMHNLLPSISIIKKRRENNAEKYAHQHREIYEAIINKDQDAVENAIKKHIDGFINDAKNGLIHD
jgi:GntR family transcriptional regulator, transcriptional repressor for pyruvate dehydrogenase complex